MVDDNLQQKHTAKNAPTKSQLFKKLIEKVQFRDKAPVYINLSTKTMTASGIMEACIDVLDGKDKDTTLYYLLARYTGKTIVFVNSIDCIRRLVPILSVLHPNVYPLHAEMQQKQRIKNLERFIANPDAVLIASDVAARGLDIPLVDIVVHYQTPRQADTYIHRSGRTARAGTQGVSILLCTPSDAPAVKKLLHTLKKDSFAAFPVDKRLVPALNKRLNLAKQIDNIKHTAKKRKTDADWFKQAAADCDIDYSGGEESETDTKSSVLPRLQRELKELLEMPLIPKGQNLKFITRHDMAAVCLESRGSNMPTLLKRKATDDFSAANQ
jgi:ATP-dependent RNA helicase DDX24/MAK5